MDLRLKSFNIMGVHKKIQFLVGGGGEGGFMKNQYIGGKLPKKVGVTQFSDLRGGWGGGGLDEKEGGWCPNAHYEGLVNF